MRALALAFCVAVAGVLCLAPARSLAATGCSANVSFSGVGGSRVFDVFQNGDCDNAALGLFDGWGAPISNDPVGYPGPREFLGSKGNRYSLVWAGPALDTYTITLVNQVAAGPETLTFSYFYDDGSPNPGNVTNAGFTIYVTLPALALTAPTIGTATAGDSQASVAFTPPSSNGGYPILYYTAIANPGGQIVNCPNSPCTLGGLTNGTPYTFTVFAVNVMGPGPTSAASNAVTPMGLPGAPTIGTATAGPRSATVTFAQPASSGGSAIVSYTVTSSPDGVQQICSGSPCTVTELTDGTAYTFTVAAANGVGLGASSAASNSVTPISAPVASNFTAANRPYNDGSASGSSIPLAGWATDNPTGYALGSASSAHGGAISVDAGGVVLYVPPVGYRGPDSFTYTASNAGGLSNVATVSLTVDNPTFSVAMPAPSGQRGVPYNTGGARIAISGGKAPYSSFSVAGLPAGLTMDSAGVISGAPTVAGSFTVTVTATDSSIGSGPFTASATAGFTVSDVAMTLPVDSPAAGLAGTAYSYTLAAATGGIGSYAYALVAGQLPDGISLNGLTLSGTPLASGTYNFTLQATDSRGAAYAVTRAYSLSIGVSALTLTPSSLPDAPFGAAYSQAFTAGAGVAPYTYALTGTLPAGMSFDAATGVLAGTPTEAGAFSLTMTAADSNRSGASSATRGFVLTVLPAVAPVVVPTQVGATADSPQTISLSGLISGVYTSVVIVDQPQHGTASVQGGLRPSGLRAQVLPTPTQILYTPNPGYSGSDSFSYAAVGPGGTSTPAVVQIAVNPTSTPSAADKTLAVVSGQSATLAATEGAQGGPFTAVAVAAAPTLGQVVVSGETIVYTPNPGVSGTDHFSYTLTNMNGVSQPIAVTVTVSPLVQVGPPITLDILAGQTATTSLTARATGGPFTSAAVVSVSPRSAGATAITSPSAGGYALTFTPAADFTGSATITYSLTNASQASGQGVVTVNVAARPDPSADAEVRGLVAAQTAAARRFANTQISNFNRRLEQLHNGGGAGGAFGVSVQGGNPDSPNGLEARERSRRYAQLGQSDAPVDRLSLLPPGGQDAGGGAKASGEPRKPSRWGSWVAGSADFGMRDTTGAQSGFRFTTDGLTAGVDYRVNDRVAVGAGLGYGHDSSRIGHDGSKSQAESYSGGVYASVQPTAGLFIDGVAGYGSLDFKTRRYVSALDELVHGDRDGHQVFASVTAGYEHRAKDYTISPYGRIGTTRSRLDAFTEVGGGPYGLTYQSQTVNTVTGTLGMRGDYTRQVSFGQVVPRFRVEYAHDFEGTGAARLNYADWAGGPTYRLMVDGVDRDQGRVELGVDFLVEKSGLRIGVDFANTVSRNGDSQGLRLSVSSGF
ncbi:MAG: autotransporter domain-containing protein [Caulobacter sp.]|nr:autotransporter domain-containing protein [Caulobacter sp.]